MLNSGFKWWRIKSDCFIHTRAAIKTGQLFRKNISEMVFIRARPRPGGSVVSVSDSWLGGCEFDPRLRRLFFPAHFRLSEACEKSSQWLWKEKVVLVLVWESQETHVRHQPLWYDLSCESGVKPQYNQPTNYQGHIHAVFSQSNWHQAYVRRSNTSSDAMVNGVANPWLHPVNYLWPGVRIYHS